MTKVQVKFSKCRRQPRDFKLKFRIWTPSSPDGHAVYEVRETWKVRELRNGSGNLTRWSRKIFEMDIKI